MSIACQGQSPCLAAVPPTMRELGPEPHTPSITKKYVWQSEACLSNICIYTRKLKRLYGVYCTELPRVAVKCRLCCIVLCCVVLYRVVLYCTVLHCVVLYCDVLHYSVLCCTVLCCAVLCCTYCVVQYSTVQYSTVQYSAVQCSAVQCSAVQCSAVQCSAVQCSAVQCSAVQHSTVLNESDIRLRQTWRSGGLRWWCLRRWCLRWRWCLRRHAHLFTDPRSQIMHPCIHSILFGLSAAISPTCCAVQIESAANITHHWSTWLRRERTYSAQDKISR